MAQYLRDLFLGSAVKTLTAVDAEPDRSNQHEIGGLVKAGFDDFMARSHFHMGLSVSQSVRQSVCWLHFSIYL